MRTAATRPLRLSKRVDLLDDDTALKRIVEAAEIPFDRREERERAYQDVVRFLDADGRRRVAARLEEAGEKLHARVGHRFTLIDFEDALGQTALPKQWIEPSSLRRATERIEEAMPTAKRNDDTLRHLSLAAIGGERLSALCRRAFALWRLAEEGSRQRAAAEAADREHEAYKQTVLRSPEYRQHLAQATAERDAARAEVERLEAWIEGGGTGGGSLFDLRPMDGGAAGTAAPEQQQQPKGPSRPSAAKPEALPAAPADGAYLDDDE